MKKIILIGFSFFFFMISPLAKTLKINDVSYEIQPGQILKTNDFTFYDSNNILELANVSFSSIEINDDLKINLKGTNKITNKNKRAGIICKNLEIVGFGNLEIESNSRGIYSQSDNVIVTNTNLTLNTEDVAIVTGITIGNLVFNNSNVKLNTKVDAFRVINGNIYFNNTNLTSTSTFIAGGFTRNLYINNSNLNTKLTNNRSITMVTKYISGNSNILIEDVNENLDLRKFILGDNLKLMGSLDNTNYQEILDNKNYKYIKIEYLDKNKIDEEELRKKENKLNKLEEELNKKENELNNKKQELIKKEDYIKKITNDLETRESELLISIKNNENLKQELITKQENIKKKEKNNLLKEQELNELRDSLSRKEEYVKNICNLENTKKTSNDNIENPKTLDDFGKLIIYFVTSLIGFGVVIYLSRRRLHESL